MDQAKLTRLAVRACRIAFRNIGGQETEYQDEVARRLQEVWEEEDIDLSSLATFDCYGGDADHTMRRVYRERQNLPPEVTCKYCGEYVLVSAATGTKFCNAECQQQSATFEQRKIREAASKSNDRHCLLRGCGNPRRDTKVTGLPEIYCQEHEDQSEEERATTKHNEKYGE